MLKSKCRILEGLAFHTLVHMSDREVALVHMSDREAALVHMSDREAALVHMSDREVALVRYFNIFFQIVFCAAILLPSTRAQKMLQNDTLCIIFGLVSQKLQRSKHCILSERYSMRDRRKNCDGLCSLYCSY